LKIIAIVFKGLGGVSRGAGLDSFLEAWRSSPFGDGRKKSKCKSLNAKVAEESLRRVRREAVVLPKADSLWE
jgi:hypothetical protein